MSGNCNGGSRSPPAWKEVSREIVCQEVRLLRLGRCGSRVFACTAATTTSQTSAEQTWLVRHFCSEPLCFASLCLGLLWDLYKSMTKQPLLTRFLLDREAEVCIAFCAQKAMRLWGPVHVQQGGGSSPASGHKVHRGNGASDVCTCSIVTRGWFVLQAVTDPEDVVLRQVIPKTTDSAPG